MNFFFTSLGYLCTNPFSSFISVFMPYTSINCFACVCNLGAWSSEDQDEKGKSILYKIITINIYSVNNYREMNVVISPVGENENNQPFLNG